jgi:hypothetical protein
MAENTMCITSSTNQGPVPWIKELSTKHLISSITCKKGRSRAKKHNKSEQITELRRFGVGRESFTVQNVHESVLGVGLSV